MQRIYIDQRLVVLAEGNGPQSIEAGNGDLVRGLRKIFAPAIFHQLRDVVAHD
jgi:hypothetical protein